VNNKIAIIGFGNIAKAIITPLLEKKLIKLQKSVIDLLENVL